MFLLIVLFGSFLGVLTGLSVLSWLLSMADYEFLKDVSFSEMLRYKVGVILLLF